MKKFLALLLAALMVLSMVGCGKKEASETSNSTATGTETSTETSTEGGEEAAEAVFAQFQNEFTMGAVTTALDSGNAGDINYSVYAGEAGKDYTDEGNYTYHDVLGGTTGMNWSPMNWETSTDSSVLDYVSSGFYAFNLNSSKDGWAVSCELASALPEDVTADYVGQYGIEEGDTAKAWKIALKDNLAFEDGTPITAADVEWSYKELLDPLMKNRRADSVYAGDFTVYNAKAYFYAGAASYTTLGELGYASVAEALADGVEEIYIDAANFWNTDDSYVDADGNVAPAYVLITDETVYGESVGDAFSGKDLYEGYFAEGADYESYGADYCCISESAGSATWDEVGIFATDDNAIVFVLTAPMPTPEYYIPYNLSSSYIVKKDLWEGLKRYFDADGNEVAAGSASAVNVTTTYGTDVATSCSYGPYMVSYFEMDKQITMVRNDNWYGYSDGAHEGQYQADNIVYNVITAHETELLEFLNGNIEVVGLQAADMAKYGTSEYISYTPQSYTTKLTWNTDPAKTTERGTQIMTCMNFRKGFAYAIDRQTFASSYTTGVAGYGMLNYMYVYDPFTGATYRDTDAAKDAIVRTYGLTYGDDGDYDDLDEAYDAVTGYDLEMARECMAQAYAECKAEGIYNDENVTLVLRVYNSDDIYVQMFNFLKDSLESACVGTGFEGKVTMEMVADADYYETNYSGGADMIFTTWGGSSYSPYTTLYQCYCDAADGSGNQMEYGFDTNNVMININVDGKDYSESLQTWAKWIDSADTKITSVDGSTTLQNFADYDSTTKSQMFANLEYAYLSEFVTTPIYYRTSAALNSQKINNAVDQYVDLVGFGGIQFLTFNYTDEEWETVKNTLTY